MTKFKEHLTSFWRYVVVVGYERFNFVGFVLLGLMFVSIPSFDGTGVGQEDGGGFWRAFAAVYVFSSALLLIVHVQTSLIRTIAWGCLGAGSFFFVFVSNTWFFWLPVAIGAWVQSVRCARGGDIGGF